MSQVLGPWPLEGMPPQCGRCSQQVKLGNSHALRRVIISDYLIQLPQRPYGEDPMTHFTGATETSVLEIPKPHSPQHQGLKSFYLPPPPILKELLKFLQRSTSHRLPASPPGLRVQNLSGQSSPSLGSSDY